MGFESVAVRVDDERTGRGIEAEMQTRVLVRRHRARRLADPQKSVAAAVAQVAIAAAQAGVAERLKGGVYPGSFLLGNAGACFECGHEHGTGDQCIAFGFAPSLFEEIAASTGGASKYRFKTARSPISPVLTSSLAEVETKAFGTGGQAAEEFAIGLAERVIGKTSAFVPRADAPSARDLRRVTDALRFIDEHCREPLDLARLADVARMSKYHFLQTFRKVVASTPHQYLLMVRLRRSAAQLAAGNDPVVTVASEAGFGDLSTFYSHFRKVFGYPPLSHRGRPTPGVPADAREHPHPAQS